VSGFVHNNIAEFPNHPVQPLQCTVSIDFCESEPAFIVKSGTISHDPSAGQPGGYFSEDSGSTWKPFGHQIGNGIN
jgi:hypothetical protein